MASTTAVLAGSNTGRSTKRGLPSLWRHIAAFALVVFALAAHGGLWVEQTACDASAGCAHRADAPSGAVESLALLAPAAESAGEDAFGPAGDEPIVVATPAGQATFSSRVAAHRKPVPRDARLGLFPDKTGPPHA